MKAMVVKTIASGIRTRFGAKKGLSRKRGGGNLSGIVNSGQFDVCVCVCVCACVCLEQSGQMIWSMVLGRRNEIDYLKI